MKKHKMENENNTIGLKDFLKKYTAVSKKFIDEYYTFYEMCEIEQYGILLDHAIKYLGIKNEEKFYENFRKKYIENIDYIKNDTKEKKKEGVKYTIYYITLDTFEKICMMSHAVKANSVRDYFLILRKFIQYYKNHISEMIINNVFDYPKGYMYIIFVNKGKNIFKIGKTNNIRRRLKEYAIGSDTHPDIKFIMLVEDKDSVETCVKNLIKKHQFKPNQEIYQVNEDIIKNSIFDCAVLNQKYSKLYDSENIDAYVVFDDAKNDIDDKIIKKVSNKSLIIKPKIKKASKPKKKSGTKK